MNIINQYEERLSSVPRWTIIRTIQKQSVAEHVYRVALMAPRIVTGYFADKSCADEARHYALLHEYDEAFSGDIAGCAKKYFDNVGFSRKIEHNENINPPLGAYAAVKIADYAEQILFCCCEVNMGNISMGQILDHAKIRLLNKLFEYQCMLAFDHKYVYTKIYAQVCEASAPIQNSLYKMLDPHKISNVYPDDEMPF